MKMTDANGIKQDYKKFTVLIPEHACKLELDVTGLTAREAASAILRHVTGLQS
jgi:hypothetical protein